MIGLDLSLTATGVACADGSLLTIRTGPGDHLADERDRLRWIADEAVARTEAARVLTFAVVEGPSFGSKGNALHQLGGLWWLVVDALMAVGAAVAVVPPGTLKVYATGSGSATKPDMRMALYKRTGLDVKDDNRVDAWWLRAMGLDYLGRPPVAMPQAQRAALGKARWPQVPRGSTAAAG
ncbi:hypothetical protein [Actinomadura opuntiae]|uniref:hypothetical protein n=1 Tax=Actinomadura sp. OS1-43 TaxID=604315 RepID=UPI00255AB9F3|nr:hypothetical protein [Actinomadura sp. OS1-43]MDL4812738.1 hypothetical protein [Actinomadura sp. OS1-43]